MSLNRLYEQHFVDVCRMLRAMGADHALADDLAQETFLAASRSGFVERSRPETLAWLRTTAKRLYWEAARRARREVPMETLDDTQQQWAHVAGEDGGEGTVEALRRCLSKLDERERRVLDLRFRRQLSREELAKALNLSDGGVKNLLERTKEKLKALVERELRRDEP